MRSEAIAPDRTLSWATPPDGAAAPPPPMSEPGETDAASVPTSPGPETSDVGGAIESPAVDAAVLPSPDAVSGDGEPAVDARSVPPGLLPPLVTAGPVDLRRGRAGHWRLDETRGNAVADSSAIGNHGGTVGIVNEDWRPGRLGNGLSFTPARRSFVAIGAHETLSPPRALSIAAWANARAWEGSPCLVQKGDLDQQYGLIVQDGRLQFFVRLAGGFVARATGPVPPAGQWVHLTGVYDGEAAHLFVDGQAVARVPAPGRPLPTYQNLSIGGRAATATASEFFAGLLDEVLLYDRALALEEIALLAAGQVP
ncbi:MAG TPA: LamG domain-containing protein [Polyangia bacterium]